MTVQSIHDKINEIIHELKQQRLWKQQAPAWVSDFAHKEVNSQDDFAGWLQFVFLPNLLPEAGNSKGVIQKQLIAPQAIRFFGEDVRKGKLLQLLIEIDSMI